MSITSTLTNALSGLTAAARTAEVISANVSNALTEGYGRREVMLSSISLNGRGAGVRVDGIRRVVDQAAIADRRLADAAFGATGARTSFLTRLEGTIGLPGDAASLSGRIAGLESALVDAASRPDSPARLRNVLDAASNLAGQFNRISTEIQSLRMDADAEISQQVGVVNDALSKISGLNNEILLHRGAGRDATALIDERQRLIDRIASIVPIREMPRENGQVALYTSGGSALLDGQPVVLGFARSNAITAEMTLEGGALSGLTLNGVPIDTGSDRGPIAGGAMAALF
jgi:flagellar hook-associated protein 1 FlgK